MNNEAIRLILVAIIFVIAAINDPCGDRGCSAQERAEAYGKR